MAPTKLIRKLNSLKKDFEDGMGSVRCRKRERVTKRIFQPNSCGNATKKRRKCSIQVEGLVRDEDYETFLIFLADHGSDVAYIDNKWVDERNDRSDVNVVKYDDGNENGMCVSDVGVNVNGMSADDVDVNANGMSADDVDVNANGMSSGDDEVNANCISVDDGDVNVNGRSVDDGNDSFEVRSLDVGLAGDGDEDPDYKIHLAKLTKGVRSCINNRSVDDDDDVHINGRYADDGDDNVHFMSWDDGIDDEDPQYKIFMENLRQDGKSYVLEVVGDNGKSELIKYEEEDEILDGTDFDTPETLKKSQVKEKPDIQKTLRRSTKRERIHCLKNSAFPVNREVTESPRTVRYDMRKENRAILEDSVPKKKSLVVKKNVKVVDLGPVFNRTDGRFNKLPSLRVLYTPETFKYSPMKKKTEHRKTLSFVITGNERSSIKKKKKNVDKKAANGSTEEHTIKTPPVEAVQFTKQGCANEKVAKGSTKESPLKRSCVEGLHFAKQVCNCGLEDEDYIKVLSCLQFVDEKMLYSPPNGRTVILGNDGQSSPDVEMKVEPSDKNFISFAAVDADSGRCVKTREASHSQFRNGLMKILNRPYDYEEYRRLLKEVTHRKPLGYDRNLRSRTCPIEEELGPSYLKQHIVLKRKIKAARGDRPRVLNLLRGFFYWLKNVAQDESFCPWNDSSCLKVLPPSDKT
ncbi:hypothetical protein D8674_034066 [Pyrus ussuriensis x Pyrus communis]|uniref:Uncharacterized protein n=1 Tax=Pyrus ussuriensis x Pyrus communis TaxID=2448454 RepID=A0A5N5HSN9_9ROSA|nr:hypothetical protein D8674_034066 [Pyrus ussuriensis x Pyrus communis]